MAAEDGPNPKTLPLSMRRHGHGAVSQVWSHRRHGNEILYGVWQPDCRGGAPFSGPVRQVRFREPLGEQILRSLRRSFTPTSCGAVSGKKSRPSSLYRMWDRQPRGQQVLYSMRQTNRNRGLFSSPTPQRCCRSRNRSHAPFGLTTSGHGGPTGTNDPIFRGGC